MVFRIEHTTVYRYSDEVALEPHLLRLTPRRCPPQTVLRHELTIYPEPGGRAELLDAEGNAILSIWFTGKTRSLEIHNFCEVETRRTNPFDYLMLRQNQNMPPSFNEVEQVALAPYLARKSQPESVGRFAAEILDRAQGRTLAFLNLLTQTLHNDFEAILRPEGRPYEPSQCLSEGKGACRDLTVLFIDACRAVGIPARFVSGYQEGDLDMEHRHLHAWPEVYMPGAGWRGYDPTTDLAVADRHIAVAASHSPEGAAPIEGSYAGTAIESVLEHELSLSICA